MSNLIQLTDQQKHEVTELLKRLVAIDSAVTSPEQANRDRVEEQMAAFVTEHLQSLGMTVERHDVVPGRPNLIGHWPDQPTGSEEGGDAVPSLMLEAHMDTVTTAGMTVDPLAGEIRDGRMYGRGTCDTKGSMAAFLTAMTIARQTGRLPTDKLYFVAVMGEETGCVGARALMETPFRTTAAIVGEATRCRVVTAHKGPLWMTIETKGRSCHASMPDHGENAIQRMGKVIEFVHGPWQEQVAKWSHPLLGASTSAATIVEGGTKNNIVPSRCTLQIDCRLVPGVSQQEVCDAFRQGLNEHLDQTMWEFAAMDMYAGLDTPGRIPFVERLLDLCRDANAQSEPEGVKYFADSGPYSEGGIQAVVFGPGDIAQAHTAAEYLELEQLYQATSILLTLFDRYSGRSLFG